MRVILWLAIAVGVFACKDKNKDTCKIAKDGTDNCRYLNSCDSDGCCVHKDLMPLAGTEAGGTVLLFFISGMTNAAGVGGGPIMTAFEILLLYFNPKQAIPLSQMIIVAGGIVSIGIRAFLRHPTMNRPLLEYHVSMMIIPPVLLGSTFGVMVNKILPNLAILVMLTIVLIFITWLTTRNGIRLLVVESKHKKLASQIAKDEVVKNEDEEAKNEDEEAKKNEEGDGENATLRGELKRINSDMIERQEGISMAGLVAPQPPFTTTDNSQPSPILQQVSESPEVLPDEFCKEINPELAAILKRESRQFPLIPSIWIIIVVIYVALGLSIRGGSGTSFADIEFCGKDFKIFFAFWSFGLLILTILPIIYLLRLKKTYERVGYEYDEFDLKWTLWKAIEVWIAGFVGGFGGGMLGFGGSILVAPILVHWRMRSPVVAPTTALMSLINSAISVMQYAQQQSLIYNYAGWLAMIAFLGSIVGVVLITRLVKKSGRSSLLVLTLAAILAISMFLVPIYTLLDIIKKEKDGSADYSLKPYCG